MTREEELRFDYLLTAAKLVTLAFRMKDQVGLQAALRSLAEVVAEFEKPDDEDADAVLIEMMLRGHRGES